MSVSTNTMTRGVSAPANESELLRFLKSEIRNRERVGIALLNFGGPWTLYDVKPFLYRLFSNPSVLVGVPSPLRQLIAFAIAQVKGASSIKSYELIGGGSPQLKWTHMQAEGLCRELANDSRVCVRVEVGMRSAEPSIENSLQELKQWGAQRLVILPLFPHFSTTTTGTCLQEVRDALRRLGWQPPTREIIHYPDHPSYAALLRRTVDEALERAEAERGAANDPIHVLFSAHSLPLKIVKRGDPYPSDIERTVGAVARGLRHPWSLCFQSRNGRMPWLEPYLEDEIARLAGEGVRRLVVAPISFVSDHIETLFELDQLYAGQARACGVTHYYRARAFNGDPEFPRVLRSVLAEAQLC
ncbi:MAG: protoporphyrin/coproporphyrin ferrochelatase [Acidobacteriota bacterium]|nr:protoporphyrin/coproporphyrin ferrochelatase [Acidobacteriota bacterium]